MQLEVYVFVKLLEVFVGGEQLNVMTVCNGAKQEIRVGALYTFCAAKVIKFCGGFEVFNVQRQIGKDM